MTKETLEQRSFGVTDGNSKEIKPQKENVDSLIVYRPRDVSIELEVESYSAMRYHGQ